MLEKKLSLLLFLLVFFISIITPSTVLAEENVFNLTNAEIKSKTETTTVNNFSFENEAITSDITFHKVGDYITYELIIKNVSDKDYTISSITDNNKNKNIIYEYDKNKGTKVKKNDSITLLIKELYKKGESDWSKRNKNLSVILTIHYIDSAGKKGASNVLFNPPTGDKIFLYVTMLIGSLFIILLVLIIKKKLNKKYAAYLMILSLILPVGVSASSTLFNITFTTNFTLYDKVVITLDIDGKESKKTIDYNTKLSLEDPSVYGKKFIRWETENGEAFDFSKPITEDTTIKATFEEKVANLQTGREVILKLYKVGGALDPYFDYEDTVVYNDGDFDVSKIKPGTKAQYDSVKNTLTSENNIISKPESESKVYIWKDSDTIYYYSEASKIYMNEDSTYIFSCLYDFVTEIDASGFDTSKVTDMSYMFAYDQKLETLNISNWDTFNVTNMFSMFYGNYSLTDVSFSSFNTSEVTNMSVMFAYNGSLTNLDLSSFDTSNVTDMSDMFEYCEKLESLDVTSFDTRKVTDMAAMFEGLSALTSLDVSNFETPSLLNMISMFSYNRSLTSLDLSSFDTSNITSLIDVFRGCNSLTNLNLSSWDTSKVTNMDSLFYEMESIKVLDLSSFSSESVTNVSGIFAYCYNLETIYATNSFDISHITGYWQGRYSFADDANLKGGKGTVHTYINVDSLYGRIDDPDNGKPGYFTLKED